VTTLTSAEMRLKAAFDRTIAKYTRKLSKEQKQTFLTLLVSRIETKTKEKSSEQLIFLLRLAIRKQYILSLDTPKDPVLAILLPWLSSNGITSATSVK